MKKILILFAFLFACLEAGAQGHNLKYRRFHKDDYNYWILEEKTNSRTNTPVTSPEGKSLPHSAGFVINKTAPNRDIELVKEILLPLLPRYESQGLVYFTINYIVLPNGSVDEVSFQFSDFDGKLNITQNEMLVWQKLSDELKRNLRFTISTNTPKARFGRAVRGVFVSRLLNPEPPKPSDRKLIKELKVWDPE